jgi:hypothetical protein
MWQTAAHCQDDVSEYSLLCPVLGFGGTMANLPFTSQDDSFMS